MPNVGTTLPGVRETTRRWGKRAGVRKTLESPGQVAESARFLPPPRHSLPGMARAKSRPPGSRPAGHGRGALAVAGAGRGLSRRGRVLSPVGLRALARLRVAAAGKGGRRAALPAA